MDGSLKSESGTPVPGVRAREGPRSELTQEALDRFLRSLDPDRDIAGAKYLEVHKNLERFFEWRGCPSPLDHADEAITRTAQRLVRGDAIRDPATYVIGVARLLFLEIQKELAKERRIAAAHAELPQTSAARPEATELRVECLHGCLDRLPADNRELILLYYEGEKGAKINNRKHLTEQLQVNVSTLRMRALRIRERLMLCVETCVSQKVA
jgi:DNA-directed RNA polymerase specialized sigma24 family protein